MAQIKIELLKNIKFLEFEIPLGGVHILTSVNGSGKTTLLTCLERLANSYAFQRHFKTSNNDQFDSFHSAKITYSHKGNSVSYQYRRTNWAPTPKKNASILRKMGFKEVIFLTSTDERFYVQNQELNTKNIIAAPTFFKDAMNELFQTNKYNELRRVKLSGKGKGNKRRNFGFLLPVLTENGQNTYYTEKNFSLGEVLMLNALSELASVSNRSLVLIDEVELALHPKVQVNFLHFLKDIALQKNLTIILSTHSSSLIRTAPNLIYLERQANGTVEVEYNCYPAIALQNVAVVEEVQPDGVFFVEDQFAQYILDELLSYYFSNLNNRRRPITKILPVAGFMQTIKFTISSTQYLIPSTTRVLCFLDLDVHTRLQTLTAKTTRTSSENEEIQLFNRNTNHIRYLPITPELGIVNLLNNDPNNHIQSLQRHFNSVFDISQIIRDENNRGINYSPNPREAAKVRISYYIERIKQATNIDETRIKIGLAEYFVSIYGPNNHSDLQRIFNPIFN